MTHQPFRFLHAADLHLERPVTGLPECPEHLLTGLLNAPQRAAEQLVQTAITEKVDFVLLCGDVISLRETGPWGAVFLLQQFERLKSAQIAVYWIGGRADDPSEWPDVLPLPDNVHFFPADDVTQTIHRRGGDPIVRILATSQGKGGTVIRPIDFPPDPDGLFTLGMVYDYTSYDLLRACGPSYWALGGGHRRETSVQGGTTIHNPGVTLARSPADGDVTGATLVTVDEMGKVTLLPVPTSPIRWTTERLVLRDEQDEESIASQMRARITGIRKAQDVELLIVSWILDVPAPLAAELRYGNLTQSLLRGIRSDFGREAPLVWSLKIEPVLSSEEDDDSERQTILGDYLRMIRFYKENPTEMMTLSDYLPDELKEYLAIHHAQARQRNKAKGETDDSKAEGETPPSGDYDLSSIRTFRPEVSELIQLLTVDADENRAYRAVTDTEKNSPRYIRWSADLETQRKEALNEAAMLGRELLLEDSSEVSATIPNTTRTIRKRTPLPTEEHKAIDSCPNGKESSRR